MPEEFLKKGGTELAPMSTTSDLKVAVQYSQGVNAVLLRLRTDSFINRGPDISFLSAFPGESEYLFPCAQPPCTQPHYPARSHASPTL